MVIGPERQPTPSRQQDGGRGMDVFVTTDDVMQLQYVEDDELLLMKACSGCWSAMEGYNVLIMCLCSR